MGKETWYINCRVFENYSFVSSLINRYVKVK